MLLALAVLMLAGPPAQAPRTPEEKADAWIAASREATLERNGELSRSIAAADEQVRKLKSQNPKDAAGKRAKGDQIRELNQRIAAMRATMKSEASPRLNLSRLKVGSIGSIPPSVPGTVSVRQQYGNSLSGYRSYSQAIEVQRTVRVVARDVVDAENLIVSFTADGEELSAAWITDWPTAGAVTDQPVQLSGLFMVIGTKSYETVLGGSHTVPLLEPFKVDLKLVAERQAAGQTQPNPDIP